METTILKGQTYDIVFKNLGEILNYRALKKSGFKKSEVRINSKCKNTFSGQCKTQNSSKTAVKTLNDTNIVGFLVKTKRTPEAEYRPYETAYDRRKRMYGIVEWQSEKGFACVRVFSNRGKFIYKECFFINELEIIMSKENLLNFLNL